METEAPAAAWAAEQVAAVRDDPAARLALVERTYRGPFGRAPRHLPYRRAAMAFMRWQLRRGVLEPPSGIIVALGPPLRGQLYETTAIPEIRDQAAALAGRLLAACRDRTAPLAAPGPPGNWARPKLGLAEPY